MQPIGAIPTASATPRPDDIRFACERCKTESVLAPSKRGLGPGGSLHARLLRIGRIFGPQSGHRSTLAEVRAELMVRAEERAYQAFTTRFRFCHECRRFVCPRCWSRSWRTCKSCVARAMAAMSPGRRRFRFGLSMTVVMASALLLAVGVGSVLAVSAVRSTAPNAAIPARSTAAATLAPVPPAAPATQPTAGPTLVVATARPTAVDPTLGDQAPTSTGPVTIACTPTKGPGPLAVDCTANSADPTAIIWLLDGDGLAPPYMLAAGHHTVQAEVLLEGVWSLTNIVEIDVS